MPPAIDRDQAADYRARWAALAQRERAELRATTVEEKFRQTAALMASARLMGWTEALASEDAAVRARWQRLRDALREQ